MGRQKEGAMGEEMGGASGGEMRGGTQGSSRVGMGGAVEGLKVVRTGEGVGGRVLGCMVSDKDEQQHLHGSSSYTITPTSSTSRGGVHGLYAYRSPQSISIQEVDSDASGSIFGPNSVHSLCNGSGQNDASGTTTPTNTDNALETLNSIWWQLQMDMEGVTITDGSCVGADMDVSFLEGACNVPEVHAQRDSDIVVGVDIRDDCMGVSSVLGAGLGHVKPENLSEAGGNWGAEAAEALKEDCVNHQEVTMEHQLAGPNVESFCDASHFMPGEEWLSSLDDAEVNDATWHIPDL